MDLMQPVLERARRSAFEQLGLPLRSVENEWGPGQVECTFAPRDALTAADNMLLFRTATRQICRRMGYFATFMCRPALKGYYSSGWHLHQSVVDAKSGGNLFMPANAGEVLSGSARLISAACCSTRCRDRVRESDRQRLSPLSRQFARAGPADLGHDHRGVMLRVLGAAGRSGQPASRTASASPPPIPISISCRRSSPASTASTMRATRARRTTEPYARIARCCRRACRSARRAGAGAAVPPRDWRRIHRLLSSSSSATKPAAYEQFAAGARPRRRRARRSPIGSRASISISSDRRNAERVHQMVLRMRCSRMTHD